MPVENRADTPALEFRGRSGKTDAEKTEVFVFQYSSIYFQDRLPASRLARSAPMLSTEDTLLKALKTSQSLETNGIRPAVLIEIAKVITPTLDALFTDSLATGKLPVEWKSTVVRSLFNGRTRGDPVNYRPVSLIRITRKMKERVIAARLQNHLLNNQLLCSEQYRYLPQRSRIA